MNDPLSRQGGISPTGEIDPKPPKGGLRIIIRIKNEINNS